MLKLAASAPFCRVLLSLSLIVGLFSAAQAQDSIEEPEGYRMSAFRAPVPPTLAGGEVVSNEAAKELHDARRVLFIDVLPRPPKPRTLPADMVWRPRKRHNIPGSVWLPNVGFGALNPEAERYFRDNLARLTEGDKTAPILIYCLTDCWMSWNAAKRALSYGYSKVYWYPEGTDGWQALGGELELSEPVPMAE